MFLAIISVILVKIQLIIVLLVLIQLIEIIFRVVHVLKHFFKILIGNVKNVFKTANNVEILLIAKFVMMDFI